MFRLKFNKNLIKSFCTKSKVKEFEKRLNTTEPSEDYASIEQYSKIFNEKISKQNVEIANKLNDIFANDTGNTGTKVFAAINEINRINLNNTSTMLSVFLNQILKYNDSVRLFIQQSEKKNNKSHFYILLTAMFAWIFGGVYLWKQYKKSINYDTYFEKMLKEYYDICPNKYKLDKEYPLFTGSDYIANIVNFVGYTNIAILGPKGVGKTQAMHNYCMKGWNKDNLVIYIDLNNIGNNNLKKIIVDTIVLDDRFKKGEKFYNIIYNKIKEKEAIIVFDNYNHKRDETLVFDNHDYINSNTKWKSIIVSENNEMYERAINSNIEVKYVQHIQSNTYKNFLYDKISNYCRKKTQYTNLELFTSDNINTLFDSFAFFSFEDLEMYLKLNNTIKCNIT
jgi:hypothetical protein